MAANTTASWNRAIRMSDAPDVLVVGAGLAGMAAACCLGEQGLRVWVVEQAPTWGGAVLRQPAGGTDARLRGRHQARWERLLERLARLHARVTVRCGLQFSGLDADGAALLVHLAHATHTMLRPKALILATGASERVRPRPGWHLPGVMTAGAIQVAMKMGSKAPHGRILLAGSGPLLLAVGAQMARMGNPPMAIVEAANPLRHWRLALRLPPDYWREAAGYWFSLQRARVPVHMNAEIRAMEQMASGLRVHIDSAGKTFYRDADAVGLHDGIDSDHYGPPAPDTIVVRRAGDCHEALGARAAAAHGESVGQEVGALLRGTSPRAGPALRRIAGERAAQAALRDIYRHDERRALRELPPDTIVCRCEGRTLNDLRALGPHASVREIRLLGRFAMGACQGRFCARWVQRLAEPADTLALGDLMGSHWPAKPLSILALVSDAAAGLDDGTGKAG